MPERPPPFDFKAIQPGIPIEFTLLKKPFSGRKEGADYDWHCYPCSFAGNERPLFTPHERVHAALQYLQVQPQGKFTITKGSDINLNTGKPFIFYTITYGDQTVDTKDTLPNQPPAPRTEEAKPNLPTDWNDVPPIKEPKGPFPSLYVEEFKQYYAPIMDIKVAYMEKRVNVQKLTDGQFAEFLLGLDKSTSANVSTILIQNGGKR